MIIEEEKKVEVIDAPKNEEKKFEQVKDSTEQSTKKGILIFFSFFAIFIFLIIIIFAIFTIYNFKCNSKISKGIYINEIDVSGLSQNEATQKIEKYYKDKMSNNIQLVCNDYVTYITPDDIELTYDIESAVNYAYQYGKSKNIFEDNYKVFSAMISGINIVPTFSINEEKLKSKLNSISSELPNAIKQSSYSIENNKLIINKGSEGVVVNKLQTINSIKQSLANINNISDPINLYTQNKFPKTINFDTIHKKVYKEAKDATYSLDPYAIYPSENGLDFDFSIEEAQNLLQTSKEDTIELPLKTLTPNITTNMLGLEAFPDLLSEFTTYYSTYERNRSTNIQLSTGSINGLVLMPGDIFSYNGVVGERTSAGGYKPAGVYENGKVVQGIGGGICQTSTTLFNAALFANLEIVEHANHMFIPSYSSAGRDATVSYGSLDFKFKNTRNHAIKIVCYAQNGVVNFKLYGFKEPTEYNVNVYAHVTSRTSTHIKSSTYRTLSLNGQVVKTENIANSTYLVH